MIIILKVTISHLAFPWMTQNLLPSIFLKPITTNNNQPTPIFAPTQRTCLGCKYFSKSMSYFKTKGHQNKLNSHFHIVLFLNWLYIVTSLIAKWKKNYLKKWRKKVGKKKLTRSPLSCWSNSHSLTQTIFDAIIRY